MNQNKIRRIENMNDMGIRIIESQTHCILKLLELFE